MPGLGLLFEDERPEDDAPPQQQRRPQPFEVDLDRIEPPGLPLWTRAAGLVAVLAVLIAARPPASSFSTEVALRRRKQPGQVWQLGPELRAFAKSPTKKAVVSSRHEWPEEPGLWARDLLLLSTGCTAKQVCFVGAAGRWWRLPRWERRFDLYAVVGLHALSLLCYHQAPDVFFAHFAPRLRRPHTLALGAFACTSPFELLWLAALTSGLGEMLQQQRQLGRLGTLGLYLGCGLASSLASTLYRRSATGAGGLLGAFAYHALAAPRATHSFFGLQLSARLGFLAQFLFASWSGLAQPAHAVPTLVVNGLPAVIGAVVFLGFG